MKCAVCKNGETKQGTIAVTLVRNSTTVVFRDVPADVCDNCGEEYLSEETTHQLLKTANEAAHSGVQVDVRRYLAA
ncbi:MAG: type II toxin-antitoxin system MqsA family antitoxin [Bacteroidota bacterium]